MFAKLFQKSPQSAHSQDNMQQSDLTPKALDPRIAVHYGIPSTGSIMAYDPFQHLLAIGTLDGRIKVIGGHNIEGLLISPKSLPFKNLEFLQNQGFLVSVSNENEIQVWDLKNRRISSNLQWESNITAFSVVYGTHYMYIGDEYGYVYVLKYDAEEGNIVQLAYHIPANLIADAAEISLGEHQPVVGLLPQPSSFNRVVIAYDNGVIILWDVKEDKACVVRSCKDVKLKDKNGKNVSGEELSDSEEEKEISCICWASCDGAVIAIGYIDGDILLWNLLGQVNDFVKLELSSSNTRLPVILLHWSPNNTHKASGGQLFVYGGVEIGSQEVLTILNLDCSSGISKLKCVERVDLPLNGSFADMILIPNTYDTSCVFVLTNPGQLHLYDTAKKHLIEYPVIIPTVNPHMSVGKLVSVGEKGDSLKDLFKTVSASENMNKGSLEWPLSGGIPYIVEEIERIYIAGYEDGSVRIWDATSPLFSTPTLLRIKVESNEVTGASSSISALNFSSSNLTLAVGNVSGLVCLYILEKYSPTTTLCVVTQTEHEVKSLQNEKGSHCVAIFSFNTSPVCSLQYSSSGNKLAVGFACGKVAMIDTSSLSVVFVTECGIGSPVISLAMKTCPESEIAFVLTKDTHLILMDTITGKIIFSQLMHQTGESTAISLHVIEANSSTPHLSVSSQDSQVRNQSDETDSLEVQNPILGQSFLDLLILVCCEDAIFFHPLKSVIQGESNSIQKLELLNPCSWITVFKKDGKECGVIIVYQSGVIEVRSFPDLEVVDQVTLMSLLHWNFKKDMDKTMSSSSKGLITLVNGCEFAFVSLLAFENELRLPQALPCLHDKVVADATDCAVSMLKNQKDPQNTSSGGLAGIIKGLTGVKAVQGDDFTESHEKLVANLESMFSRFPFSDISTTIEDDLEGVTLNIDDVEIDEPVVVTSSKSNHDRIAPEKENERDKLFEGGSTEKPKMRTRDEIIAKYRNTGDAASAASEAKDKLMERGEKLEKLKRNTEELQSGAENFADLAKELARKMEQRKWWQL